MTSMIGWIEGQARSENVVVTTGGVGYTVVCARPLIAGEHVELLVTTIIKQDSIELYGFDDVLSQHCFEAILKAPGIGPAKVMALIAGLGVPGVAAAVATQDAAALSTVRGIGVALARKLIASVRLPDDVAATASQAGPADMDVDSVIETLTGLGFDAEAAGDAARAARTDGGDELGVDSLLAAAIVNLRSAA